MLRVPPGCLDLESPPLSSRSTQSQRTGFRKGRKHPAFSLPLWPIELELEVQEKLCFLLLRLGERREISGVCIEGLLSENKTLVHMIL